MQISHTPFMSLHVLRFIKLSFALMVTFVGAMTPAFAEQPESMLSGTYHLDAKHTSIVFRLNHLGFSHFTGRFNKSEGTLDFHPDAPEQSALDITVYPGTIDTNVPELDEALYGQTWLDAQKFPYAKFQTKHIERTGPQTAKIIGAFTLHGVTHNLTLDTVLVGAGKMPLTGEEVMGFSATGSFNRSDYGLSNLLPMVGDLVTLQIDTEFDKEK